jgi:YVTN family beta-propeller protein
MQMPCNWGKPTPSTTLALVISFALAGASPATAVPTGEAPLGVGINERTNRIYVTNYSSGSVTVINGDTTTSGATLPVGVLPEGLVVNHETNRIFVSNFGSSSVSVIEGATDTVVKTLAIEACCPFNVVADEAGNRLFVTNAGTPPANSDHITGVAVIDGDTDTLTGTLLGGDGPFGVAVNPSTQRIYISNFANNNVSVLLENELLQNPSFELHTGLRPDFWVRHHLDSRFDRWTPRVEDYEADASFRLTGAAGVVKWLSQEISASGPAGTRLHVEGFSKAARQTAPSPPGGRYAILTTVFYSDGSSQSLALNYTPGPHDWQRRAKSIVTEKDFDRMVVRIFYANQEGTVWFDGLHVWTEPPQ